MNKKELSLPKKLYKYESWNEQSLANLKNQQLYFSDPRLFNDPFDSSIGCIFEDITEEEFSLLHSHNRNNYPNESKFIKEYGDTPSEKFKSFIRPILEDEFKKATDQFFNKNGVTCFSESNDEILMWSHYAKSHTGFCLEFDTSIEPFNKARKVEYQTGFPSINPAKAFLDPDSSEALKLALTKYKKWEYEKEWRLVHKERNKLFGYPTEALTAIYFGAKINPAHLEILILLLQGQNPHVAFYNGRKSKTQFKVEFNRFEYTSYLEAKRSGLA